MRIEFFIPGTSRPAGSKSAFKLPLTGRLIVTHANPATKQWMNTVRFFAMKAANRMIPTTEAVCLKLIFLRQRAETHYGTGRNAGKLKPSAPEHYTHTPDLTKLVRAVEDGMTGIIWQDDKQVVVQATMKRYCRAGEIPGVKVIIETIEETQMMGNYECSIKDAGTKTLFS